MLDHTISLSWLNSTGKKSVLFLKSITCKDLAINWFPDWGKMVHNRAPLPSQSQNQTTHSPHNLTLLKNKSDTYPVKRKLYENITSLYFSEHGWLWFNAGSCIHIQPQRLYHLATSSLSLMFKCGILHGPTSFQKK